MVAKTERVLVLKNGRVQPGRRALWEQYLKVEVATLREIYAEPYFADQWKRISKWSEAQWKKEARHSVVSASYRLGSGEVWLVSPGKRSKL